MTHENIPSDADRSSPPSIYLDWFTSKIWPDGTQSVLIRPSITHNGGSIELSHHDSQLLIALFNEIVEDRSIPWSQTRQAILRAFQIAPNIQNPDPGERP